MNISETKQIWTLIIYFFANNILDNNHEFKLEASFKIENKSDWLKSSVISNKANK